MNSQAGVIVDFKGSHIGVFSDSSAKGKGALRGELMLVANFILRTASLSKKTDAKAFYLTYLHDGVGGIARLMDNFADGYKAYYKVEDIVFEHKLVENSDRQFSFVLFYGEVKGHTTSFKPKGFGLLGKNIDASAMFASLLLLDFLIEKYDKSEKIIDMFDSVIKEAANTIDTHDGRCGIKVEWAKVEEIGEML